VIVLGRAEPSQVDRAWARVPNLASYDMLQWGNEIIVDKCQYKDWQFSESHKPQKKFGFQNNSILIRGRCYSWQIALVTKWKEQTNHEK
jgi:hypothetical protein